MTLLLWSVVAAICLPYASTTVRAIAIARETKKVPERNHPRRAVSQLPDGLAARADAAEKNAWEALAMFAPVALIAHMLNADTVQAGYAGAAWVVFRLLHLVFYAADRPDLRSTMFTLAACCVAYLVYLCAIA